jgi:hypothetical protein
MAEVMMASEIEERPKDVFKLFTATGKMEVFNKKNYPLVQNSRINFGNADFYVTYVNPGQNFANLTCKELPTDIAVDKKYMVGGRELVVNKIDDNKITISFI